jgi:hypothetical protein
VGCKVHLLEDEVLSFLVCLDELHRNQHESRPKEARPYPDVCWLAVRVHEDSLSSTYLLTHGVVDRVTSVPFGCRRARVAHNGLLAYSSSDISFSFRAGQVSGPAQRRSTGCRGHCPVISTNDTVRLRASGEGCLTEAKRAGSPTRFSGYQRFVTTGSTRRPTPCTGGRSGALGVIGVLGERVDNHHAKRDDYYCKHRCRRDDE